MSILAYGLGLSGGSGFEENAVRFADMKNADIKNVEVSASASKGTIVANLQTKKNPSAAIASKKLNASGIKPKLSANLEN